MDTRKPKKKAVKALLYGHSWTVYPMSCRGKEIFRVFHRVNGERVPKTFMSMADAKADAKSILKELYGKADSKIHLSDAERRDWKAAVGLKKQAGIQSSLESIVRHYADLVKVVGHESLITDVVRKHAESRGKSATPVKLARLRDDYLDALKKKDSSVRYLEAQRSHTGQFLTDAGDVMSDQVTQELIQDFLDGKKAVDARTKRNLLDAVKAMMKFGQSNRQVPKDWDEAEHVIRPTVKPKTVKTYTAEELKKLLAAAPKKFRPILALSAFGGLRSSEIELLDWKHIRLLEKKPDDRIIRLDIDVTDVASRRTVPITDILYAWLAGPYKHAGKVWTGTHDDFYRMQQVISKNSGVPWKQNALRHTCISAKVATTRDVGKVAYESGNSVAVIKEHYLNLMPPSQAQAWFSVTRSVVGKYEREIG